MKRILIYIFAAYCSIFAAHAGTLTVTASGFSTLGPSAPANWPTATVTFPGSGNPNGTKAYTVSDADWLLLLTWMAANHQPEIQGVTGPPSAGQPLTPTAPQMLLAWLQIWINGTKSSVSQFNTIPAVTPAPITIQ